MSLLLIFYPGTHSDCIYIRCYSNCDDVFCLCSFEGSASERLVQIKTFVLSTNIISFFLTSDEVFLSIM